MSLQLSFALYFKFSFFFRLIEFGVSSYQFIYRTSVPLKSLGIINRSIFSLPVIFVVVAHSVYVCGRH